MLVERASSGRDGDDGTNRRRVTTTDGPFAETKEQLGGNT